MVFRKKHKQAQQRPKNGLEVVSEYIQALVGALVLAVLIRGFLFEPFKIPSESMVPTLLVGDHIFVERFKYGLRIPWTKKWLTEFDDPKRGDVVVFSYPQDEDVDFIKRIIGIPGDTVRVTPDKVFVNGKELDQKDFMVDGLNPDNNRLMVLTPEAERTVPDYLKPFPYYREYRNYDHKIESLDDDKTFHYAQRSKIMRREKDEEFVVPPRNFFVMGDNRDESQDSRFWGFVPRENFKGKAIFIWLSLDNDRGWFRWNRFGRKII
jgi:signal peptidase I